MASYFWLAPLGFVIGAYGTLIGAGGGFVLVPLLLLLYPTESSDVITSISLAVVFCNALSGSAAYARSKRIDYRAGVLFSIATIPGAILGALTTAYIPRHFFNLLLGLILLIGAGFLLRYPPKEPSEPGDASEQGATQGLADASKAQDGGRQPLPFNLSLGIGLSVVVGYLSSLLGIGGGIIHVPALVHLLNFPAHIATATSHFVLAVMALTGTLVHIATGAFHHGVHRTIALSLGVLPGAQVGAWLSQRVRGEWIMRGLAIALGLVGLRLLLSV
ncbi:MAG: sulfite exporter TauE/SafE family protein [Candidatus Binatia bacterium]